MNAIDIYDKLLQYTIAKSGAERRAYLGMSRISDCPRVLYRELVAGGERDWSIAMHLNCYAGYLYERDIKERLGNLNLYVPGSERELVANFDQRFRGHTDGAISDGRLLEIKSTVQSNLADIIARHRLPYRHYQQVQIYLHHGGFPGAVVVYVARDTGNLHVEEIRPHPSVADDLNAKARRILDALDSPIDHIEPACECHRCK